MGYGYINDSAVKKILESTVNPLKGRLKQISGGDFNWFSDDFELAFPDILNDKFSDIAVRMRMVSKDCKKNKILADSGEENILDLLTSDITRCATNVGWFGHNIAKSNKNRSMISNSNSKLVFNYVIDEMSKSFKQGFESINEKDLLCWNFTANMGHNPTEFHPWKNDAASKIDFVDRYFTSYRQDHTKDTKRKIIVGYRKTLDKPGKLRPAFLLNRDSGKLFETVYSAEEQPFRVRSIAAIPWYDNSWLMFANQCILLGKTPFLEKHVGFNTNNLADKVNDVVRKGKEPFASDIASADYTHKKEDIKYFFERFLDGKFLPTYQGLFEDMDIMGSFRDLENKEKYYIQKNYGRFLSGSGLTYWINVAKYLSNQILNLVSQERVLSNGLPVWERNSGLITEEEIKRVDCLNKGDDALDFIRKGSEPVYKNVIKDNPFCEVEQEPFLSFDGKRLISKDNIYFIRSKYKTILINSIEKREIRKPDNPLVPSFYSSMEGKLDLLELHPTIDKDLGLELLRLVNYMITGSTRLSHDEIRKRAILERKFLVSNERARNIQLAVDFLGLNNVNELNYNTNARTLGELPLDILNNIFISKKMKDIKSYFYDL